MRHTGPSRKTCQALWERADGCCEVCGRIIRDGEDFSRQHRRARGMGGSKRPDTNSLANLLLACGSATSPDGCHYRIEANPDWARSKGYRVTQFQDPALVPVWVAWVGEVLLAPDSPAYVRVGDYPRGAA